MIVLFIGFGSIAQQHKAAIWSIEPGAIIYALRSKKDSPLIPGVVSLYDWSEVPTNVDFAIIATPTFLHKEALEILLHKNIPTVIEKPIANTLDGLDSLAKQIRIKQAFVYVACNLRFLPSLRFLKNYIQQNMPVINEVNVYCGSFLPAWRAETDFKKNYSANVNMGGGVHLDLFHELDYTSWIFGLPYHSQVVKRNVSSLNINASDYAAYLWEYEKFTASIILNYYRPIAKREIEIVFADEVWNVTLLNNEIRNSKNEIIFADYKHKIADTYADQIAYVIDCIKNQQQPDLNTFNTSLEILKICLS